MQKNNRVVVTGFGVIAPNGIGVKDFFENSHAGKSGCRQIDLFDIDCGFGKNAGIIAEFVPQSFYGQSSNSLDRVQLLAQYCIDEALSQANLKGNPGLLADIFLCLATAIGPMATMESFFNDKVKSIPSADLQSLNKFSFGYLSESLADNFSFKAGNVIIPTGCVGGCDAVTYATNAIRQGKYDCVVAGASEAPITPLVVAAFGQIGANSTRECLAQAASCPFDLRRDGFVLGEGAAVLVLESEMHALQRGATIYAEIKGIASTNNCLHMTDIDPAGEHIANTIRLALQDANLCANDIDYINAHGSSTVQNDVAEANAIKQIFGDDKSQELPVTSIKSQIGHALAAANAIELVSVVQSLDKQIIPPTINLEQPDPECCINVVANIGQQCSMAHVLKTSSGFSGIHTAVVMSKYDKRKWNDDQYCC